MTWRAFGIMLLLAWPAAAQFDPFEGDVPYVPTPAPVVEAMLKLGRIQASDFVIDLGCGDGRIVVMAAAKFGARGLGYDLNPERISEAEANAKQEGVTDRVRFVKQDLFGADVRQATLVTLYLLPDVNLQLRPRLLRELKTGTRIVSHSFDMGDWKPDQRIEFNGKTLYLWEVTEKAKAQFAAPEKPGGADGAWEYSMPSPVGEAKAELTLKTEGGKLSGFFLFPENRRLEITEGTIQGDEVSMVVKRDRQGGGTMVYRMKGKITGDRMEGKATAEMDGQTSEINWSAKRK